MRPDRECHQLLRDFRQTKATPASISDGNGNGIDVGTGVRCRRLRGNPPVNRMADGRSGAGPLHIIGCRVPPVLGAGRIGIHLIGNRLCRDGVGHQPGSRGASAASSFIEAQGIRQPRCAGDGDRAGGVDIVRQQRLGAEVEIGCRDPACGNDRCCRREREVRRVRGDAPAILAGENLINRRGSVRPLRRARERGGVGPCWKCCLTGENSPICRDGGVVVSRAVRW